MKNKKHILTEAKVQKFVRDNWLYKNGWNIRYKGASSGDSGVDIEVNNSNIHKFLIECKGSKNYENDFINALGQICTRMTRKKPKGINYGIALLKKGADIARRRIPKSFALHNQLNVFSVSDNGKIVRYKPGDMKG